KRPRSRSLLEVVSIYIASFRCKLHCPCRITRTTTYLSSALDVLPDGSPRNPTSQAPSTKNAQSRIANCEATISLSLIIGVCLELGSWGLEVFESRLYYNRRTLIDNFEQFDHVLVTHPHATVTRSRADFILVFGAMNVDVAVARIRILLVQSVEPQNTRRHQVLRRRRRFVGLKRNAPHKNGSVWHIASDLLRHAKTAGRRFEAPLLRPDTESRRRHGVGADRLLILYDGELLVSN